MFSGVVCCNEGKNYAKTERKQGYDTSPAIVRREPPQQSADYRKQANRAP